MWEFALSIIVNSQGKIKENFITSACPIFLLRISRLTRYSLYSLVESNWVTNAANLNLMPCRLPFCILAGISPVHFDSKSKNDVYIRIF